MDNIQDWIELRNDYNKNRNFIGHKGEMFFLSNFIKIGDELCKENIELQQTINDISKKLVALSELEKESVKLNEHVFNIKPFGSFK